MISNSILSHERAPIPGVLLKCAVVLCGIVPLILYFRLTPEIHFPVVVTSLLASSLLFFGWSLSSSYPNRLSESRWWWLQCAGAIVVSLIGLFLADLFSFWGFFWLVLPAGLLYLHSRMNRERKLVRQCIVSLLFGSIFMFVSASLGVERLGAFPAVIAVLFIAVLRATIDIEEEVIRTYSDVDVVAVEDHYRHRLTITAVIFFLFGTVSLWPWLGEVYGQAYFWILLLGVLLPLAFFWGRIRQPKLEGARVALTRFNRIAPLLGLFHIIAILAS
ncbi:hypothetical protein KJZ99_01280 [bacterium]|nr:hypothetical protein [bacterium]